MKIKDIVNKNVKHKWTEYRSLGDPFNKVLPGTGMGTNFYTLLSIPQVTAK